MGPRPGPCVFVKLRHKLSIFTPTNIGALRSSLDVNDLVCLVFLMCKDDQIENMYEFLTSTDCVNLTSQDLYVLLQTFPEWERKLLEALGAVKNELALMKLGIRPKDIDYIRRFKDSELALCPTRVALYRIIDELRIRGGENLIKKMVDSGAPQPPTFSRLHNVAHVELLCFMYWHSRRFLNFANRQNFHVIAESLKTIPDKEDLADYFITPQVLHDSYVFDEHPLGVYEVKNSKNPGLCVIVNQVRYGGKNRSKDRDSSLVNADDLAQRMRTLDFSVVTIEDLSEPEFCSRIKATVESEFSSDHSIFILVIMGHGGVEGVFCPSEKLMFDAKSECTGSTAQFSLKAVHIEDIQYCLFDCKELENIPKVLMLNSCRGDFEFTTRDYFLMAADAPIKKEIISHVDLITCYSALPNYVSWRDPKKGSLFIQLFCDLLDKKSDMEVCEMFTLMNARLMLPTVDLGPAFMPGHFGYEKRVGLPFDFTSSLRKKLYFRLPETLRTT